MEKDILRKWLEGSMNEEEKKAFESTEDFKKLKKILKSSQYFKAPEYDIESELDRLYERKEDPEKSGGIKYIRPLIRIAATFLIFFSIWWIFLREDPTTIRTFAGEKSELILPDSSKVYLNAMSSLSYNKKNWDVEREIQLNGEAYFKVTEGARFDVVTPQGIVSVLGTQFNVKQRENYFEVICFDGQVSVNRNGNQVKLSQSKMFRVINGEVSEDHKFTFQSPGWMEDKSQFQSTPYSEVIHEFERQYNVSIKIKNIDANQLFTGGFTHKDLSSALQSISLPLNATYDIKNDRHIVLSGDTN